MDLSTARRRYGPATISLLLIAGVWLDWRSFHLPPGDAGAYHASVRAIVAQMPDRIGDWISSVIEPPPSATALLRPNVLAGREFRNVATGERATFALVQCRDARDMGGHWPPVCYPAQGWTLRDTQRKALAVGERSIPVTVYHFTIESIERYSELIVYNFFLRPDGVIDDDRAGVRDAADDPRMKVFGAAQVQVTFEPSIVADRRDQIFAALVGGIGPIIDAVLAGRGSR